MHGAMQKANMVLPPADASVKPLMFSVR